ncbi:MAG: SRPBCC family protein [Armatimonadetes bacterium]|nr:SRPBCC family protein [Armatimonadota bacterium]
MPHIENEVLVNAPLEKVYALAKDVESFPQFMPDVESIHIAERSADGQRTVTDWVGVASDFKLKVRWTEEDLWDDAAHTCRFSQVKGDYQQYGGTWTFTQEAGGRTRFASAIDYELDIPLIGPLLKSLVAKLMRENTQRILDAIKRRAEGA